MISRTMSAMMAAALALCLLPSVQVFAEETSAPFVLMAELEIDPAQLENYKAAVKEIVETSVQTEPGCLAINATFEKDNPTHFRFFEIYADVNAFKAHLETAHFKKYAVATKDMVKSRKRIEVVPLVLKVKEK